MYIFFLLTNKEVRSNRKQERKSKGGKKGGEGELEKISHLHCYLTNIE